MIDFTNANLKDVAITWVGNKSRIEGVKIPKTTPALDIVSEEMLLTTILKALSGDKQYWYLSEPEDSLNRAKAAIEAVFNDPDMLTEASKELTNLLYEQMDHAKPTGGEFIIAKIDDLIFEGEPVNGIALWKIDRRSNYLSITMTPEHGLMQVNAGIDLSRVEMCALILDVDPNEGYRVIAFDKVTQAGERSLWMDGFLRLRPLEDEYFQTSHYMGVTSEFIRDKTMKYGLTRPEKMALLNRAGDYFKYNDELEINNLFESIFEGNDEMVEDFNDFMDAYKKAYNVSFEDSFEISKAAHKKFAKLFRTTLKLDKNFRLSMNTSRKDLMKQGMEEETGKRYYQIFYDDEV